MEEDIETIIKKIIFDKFKLEVDNNTNLYGIIQDSFAKIEMLFEIEEFLGVKIPETKLADIETVGDLINAFKN